MFIEGCAGESWRWRRLTVWGAVRLRLPVRVDYRELERQAGQWLAEGVASGGLRCEFGKLAGGGTSGKFIRGIVGLGAQGWWWGQGEEAGSSVSRLAS